jgi:hypothetical protein
MQQRQTNVNTITLAIVFDFLQPSVASQKAESTIHSHVAVLKFYFQLFERSDLAQLKMLDLFLAGAQRLAPAPCRNLWIWDAGVPLRMIRDRAPPTEFLSAA